MQPNLSSNATITVIGLMSSSPDIWIGGTSPIANYETVLASDESDSSPLFLQFVQL